MQKEQLSAYMDGEQVDPTFTTKLSFDEKLQQSWASFHAIRSVMREESAVFLGTDFTAKMAQLIADEAEIQPTLTEQPTPAEAQQSPFMQKLKAMFAPLTQVAVAAAVCLVAVLGVQNFTANQEQKVADTPVLQTLPFNNAVQQVSYNAPAKDMVSNEQIEQKNKRIGAMLQNYELQRRLNADGVNLGQK